MKSSNQNPLAPGRGQGLSGVAVMINNANIVGLSASILGAQVIDFDKMVRPRNYATPFSA